MAATIHDLIACTRAACSMIFGHHRTTLHATSQNLIRVQLRTKKKVVTRESFQA